MNLRGSMDLLSVIALIGFILLISTFAVGAVVLNYLRHKDVEMQVSTAEEPAARNAEHAAVMAGEEELETAPLGKSLGSRSAAAGWK